MFWLGFFFTRSLIRGARRRAERPPYVPYTGPHGSVYKTSYSSVVGIALIIAAVLVVAALAG